MRVCADHFINTLFDSVVQNLTTLRIRGAYGFHASTTVSRVSDEMKRQCMAFTDNNIKMGSFPRKGTCAYDIVKFPVSAIEMIVRNTRLIKNSASYNSMTNFPCVRSNTVVEGISDFYRIKWRKKTPALYRSLLAKTIPNITWYG